MRVIPTPLHGIADYFVGGMLLVVPWMVGFAEVTTLGAWISAVAGAALLGMSMFTDYEGAVFRRVVSMRTHLTVDVVLGAILVVSPFAFGFASEGTWAWLPFVLLGGSLVVLAPLAQLDSLDNQEVRRQRRLYAQHARALDLRSRRA